MEELGLLGNTSYSNPADGDDQALPQPAQRLAADGGERRQHLIYDAPGGSISKAIFKQGLKTLPSQYQRKSRLCNLHSRN
jgi:hypothetical protein